MATIQGILNAGAWIFTGAAVVAIVVALILQIVKDNVRLESLNNPTDKTVKVLGKVLHSPPATVIILTLSAIAFFAKALAYWGMFFGVGVTGPVFWGSQLGWIFYWFFTSFALGLYVCLRNEWYYAMPYGFAAAAGSFFVATFVAPANQLAFVLLGGVLALILIIALGVFGIRKDWKAIVAIVAFALVIFVGYILPYILSPQYQNQITTLSTLIWYLIIDCVIVLWVAFMVITAMDCGQVEAYLMKDLEKTPKPCASKNARFQN